MKIKIENILLIGITFLVIINLQILNFGDYAKVYRYMTFFITVILALFCLLNKKIYHKIFLYSKFFNKWIIIYFTFLFFETINGLLFGGKSITEVVGIAYIYNGWLLLFYPIMYILLRPNGLKKMTIILSTCTVFALVLKTIVWWIYNYQHKDIMHYLLYEFGPEPWIRDGFQRIPSTCFSGILFSFMIYLFFYTKNWKIKILSVVVNIFNIWYANSVFASRAQMITFVMVLFISFILVRISIVKKIIINIIFILLCITLVIFNMDYINEFINSLTQETFSIGIRFVALDYYINLFTENWMMGIYMLVNEDTINGSRGVFFLSDLGILGDLFAWGIIGFTLMLIPFIRMLFILKKINNKDNKYYVFALSLLLYTIISSCLSNDIYSFRNIFGLSFIIAYFEFWRTNISLKIN